MKKARRITKITFESERTFIFRNSAAQQSLWCERCGAKTQMAGVADAAREAGISELAVYQLLDAGTLHFNEDSEGRLLICLNSLLK